MSNESTIKIFIAYSREDTSILNKLRTNLKVLERAHNVKVWYDGEIEVGSDWEKSIKTHLHTADIILLLISENFIASDYCYNNEMTEALSLHDQEKVRTIPIIAKECLWQDTPFARLQALPQDGKPITSSDWSTPNRPYLNVVEQLRAKVKDIREKRQRIVVDDTSNATSFYTASKSKKFLLVIPLLLILILGAWGGSKLWKNDTAQIDKEVTGIETNTQQDYITFGWHPYWVDDAYNNYRFELLDYISWFAYEIIPETGNYSNISAIEKLKTKGLELIKKAKEKNCKVLLTITNNGRENTNQFLLNQSGQQSVLIDSVLNLVKTLNLDGVDLNFENVDPKSGKKMTAFVKKLSDAIKLSKLEYVFSLTLPKVNRNHFADLESLNRYVDLFVLRGYEFHTESSSKDGPISPLYAGDGQLSIEAMVNHYLASDIDASKLLLGLPYYGAIWTSDNNELQNQNRSFIKSATYRQIKFAMHRDEHSPQYDSLSGSAYYIKQLESGKFEKTWFEDENTINNKLQWVINKGLGGVGIWALGYDEGYSELWDVYENTKKKKEAIE